jgi:hypothetical protein
MGIALFLVGLLASQTGLSGVPQLQAGKDFDVELGSLPVFLKSLSKEVGIELYNGTTLNDIKIDVFVKNQPLHKTLTNLADALDAEWISDAGGFRLSRPSERNTVEQRYVEAEEKLAMQKLDHEIAVYRRIGQLVPASDKFRFETVNGFPDRSKAFQEWRPQFDLAEKQYQAAINKSTSVNDLAALKVERDALYKVVTNSADLITTRLLTQMSDADINVLKAGEPYAISNLPQSKFRFSLGDDPMQMRFNGPDGKPMEPRILTLIRVDPFNLDLSSRTFSYSDSSTGTSGRGRKDIPFELVPTELKGHPFIQANNAWSQAKQFPELLAGPISDSKLTEGPQKWWVKGYRLGDHLRWFHEATGIPVVAMSDRVMTKIYSLNVTAKTQGEHLKSLVERVNGYARVDDGFLKVRNGSFWRHRRLEVPEAVYAPIEAASKKRELNLEDYANFSTGITLQQAVRLLGEQGILKQFSGRPLTGIVALKLYGSLSRSQSSLANQPNGLSYSSLGPEQRKYFQNAIISALFYSGNSSEVFIKTLVTNGMNEAELSKMSLRMTKTGKGSYAYGKTGGYGDIPDLLPEEKFDYDSAPLLELGYDGKNCVSFAFEVFGIAKPKSN